VQLLPAVSHHARPALSPCAAADHVGATALSNRHHRPRERVALEWRMPILSQDSVSSVAEICELMSPKPKASPLQSECYHPCYVLRICGSRCSSSGRFAPQAFPSATPGHTCAHEIMAGREAATQRADAFQCRAQLENWIGRPVNAFAFPHGRLGSDFDEASARAIADVGYKLGFAVDGGWFQMDRSLAWLSIPRFTVPNVDGSRFSELLTGWWTACQTKCPW
jgi:hypothetical protein